ncbi:M42 family metallopeptidase [Acholeplasma sp. OttesenSCG-928-E16]|nr:M42 family metallopeptidase [Acholeplasma sp. OttesenSCG-928-E16]
MDEIKNLKNLTMLSGVPAYEKEVSNYIKSEIKNYVSEVSYDNLGSLIASKKGNGPTIMISAHMDEIGLMITEISKDGFLKFTPLGGWFSQVMLAQLWQINTKKGIVYAVSGVKPPHLIPADKRKDAIPIDQMYLDIGVNSKEGAIELGIELGNMVTPVTEFKELGNGDYLLGKAFDDRIGCAVAMAILKDLDEHPNNLYASFTTQEEVGLRGAKTSSYVINPKIAFAIDSGVGNDVPGGNLSSDSQVKLGAGPQIHLSDGGLIAHQGLRKFVIDVAKELNIPYQEPYLVSGATDAGAIHVAHDGAAALSIGIPTRYMHSHTSIVHKDDYFNAIKLLTEVIKRLDDQKVKEILSY